MYIPNYLQALDYLNGEETPASASSSQQHFQQSDFFDDRYNDEFDPFASELFQTTSTPSIQFLFDTTAIPNDIDNIGISTTTTLTTTVLTTTDSESTTDAIVVMNMTSTEMEQTSPMTDMMTSANIDNILYSSSSSIEIDSIEGQTSSTLFSNDNVTKMTIVSNQTSEIPAVTKTNDRTDFILHLLNRTGLFRKNFIRSAQFNENNLTAEQKAQHLADKKMMQSLIHSLPSDIWSQLQRNLTTITFNQTEYMQPSAADSVILAEAAAQAGLHVPGQTYPMLNHRWQQSPSFYQNLPQTPHYFSFTKFMTTCS